MSAAKLTMACKHCSLSGNIPTLADINSSPASTKDLWVIVQTFDTGISHVEALLKELILKRAILKRKINHHTSPLLRIPSDITSEIFKACLLNHHKEEWNDGTETKQEQNEEHSSALPIPFLFGSVCHMWRELVWSLPWVWSSITLELCAPSLTYASLMDAWLSHSGAYPLTIILKVEESDELEENTDAAPRVVDIIGRFSKHWCHIRFDLPLLYYESLCSVQGHIPLLRSMSLKVLGWYEGSLEVDSLYMFSIAPQLQVVHCGGFPPGKLILPLAQLTSLSGYPYDIIPQCLEVLEVAPHLKHASFTQILPKRFCHL